MAKIAWIIASTARAFGARDAAFLLGFVLLVAGLALVSWAAALIVPGVILIALALWPYMLRRPQRRER